MTCSNRTEAFVGETHTCHQPHDHPGMHSCGCGRTWHRLNEQGLTADDEPARRPAGMKLTDGELQRIAAENEAVFETFVSLEHSPTQWGDGVLYPRDVRRALLDIRLLLGHLAAVESDLASCRAGQPRHKDQDMRFNVGGQTVTASPWTPVKPRITIDPTPDSDRQTFHRALYWLGVLPEVWLAPRGIRPSGDQT